MSTIELNGVARNLMEVRAMIPGFQYEDRRGMFLNLCLDVEMGGVTYHLTSEFEGQSQMGAVIDTIELERAQRQTA